MDFPSYFGFREILFQHYFGSVQSLSDSNFIMGEIGPELCNIE